MSGWRDGTLGDVLVLQRGFDLPNSSRRPGGVPVVSSAGVTGTHDEAKVQGPGVVIGRYGTLGEVHYVTQPFWPLNTTLWVKDFKGNDTRFCSYLLQTIGIAETSGASAVPGVNRNVLHGLPLRYPPLDIQRRIVSILGAYDDLIEVNRRRVAVLEGQARGLFEEWFVRFRFPGHERVAIHETPDGPLPEGWTAQTLLDFLVLQRGFDLPTSTRQPGTIPVISASGRHGSHSEVKIHGPGVVTGRSGTIGQVHLVMEDHWPLNTTLYVKEFKKAGAAFATLLLRHLELGKSSSGSAVPTLNRNHVHGVRVAAAPDALLRRFEDMAMANFKAADVITRQSSLLAASRDLLLPRLISGQLSLDAATRQLEEAA